MSKLKVLDKKSERSINSERELLSKLHNDFIVNMHYAFQDSENLYLVMDLMTGGDLRFHISRHKKFSEEQTRFFLCGIIIALEYIHSNNIIHRDIKPENLVLDENGYVRLTDFGIAKENMPDNRSETSGTPGYMSPEVMRALNHSFPVDFFALGVIGYEFMKGERPYVGRNRKEIKEQIMAKQVELQKEDISEGWSKESADFINKALIRKPENRIGYKGINELRAHPWLKYYPWEMLYRKSLPSPFIPENKDNFDKRYCESSDLITEDTKLRYEEILMSDHYNTAFTKFYYNIDENQKKKINNNKLKKKINNKDNNIKSQSQKIIINQYNKTNINNDIHKKKILYYNANLNNKKNENNNLRNSANKMLNSVNNAIIKNHKKSSSEINNNINTNIGGNVSNNVIYINFNINHQNIQGNSYNNNQSAKTDRIQKQYKNSARNIYFGGNTINNMNNNIIQKFGINIEGFESPNDTVKKLNNNYQSGEKKPNIKLGKKTKKVSNNTINTKNNNKKKNNKNIYNSMKDLYESKDRTGELDLLDSKNIKKSGFSTNRNNVESLSKTKIEIQKNVKDLTHSYSFKDSNNEEDKKEIIIQRNNNIHANGKDYNKKMSKNNINHYSLKKVILQYNSPKNHKNNMTNDSSSIVNNIKDKLNKNSRAYINNYSNNNDLSTSKSKTFLKEKPSVKDIKKNFYYDKNRNNDVIYSYKNKKIKNHINQKFFSNDNKKNNKINRNSDINLHDSKIKNSSLDKYKEKDNFTKNVNVNKNNITLNKTINIINKKTHQKINQNNENTKVIFQNKKNNYFTNNKFYCNSKNEAKLTNNKNIKTNQFNHTKNNLSLSSSTNMKNKKKEMYNNSCLNINDGLNKEKESIKDYIYVRNNGLSNNNQRNFNSSVQERNYNNLMLSYREKNSSIK